MSSHVVVTALSTAVVGLAMSGAAQAVTVERVFAQQPATACQSALPVFDGVIRKRPKAVQNEGTSTSFVTCAFSSQGADAPTTTDPNNPTELTIYFITNAGAQTVSCTAATGWAGQTGTNGTAVTKTTNVTLSSSLAAITWTGEDWTAGATVLPSSLIAVSCQLPPGVGIADSYIYFNEEIGAAGT